MASVRNSSSLRDRNVSDMISFHAGKVRDKPRIGINDLAVYMSSTTTAQLSIIKRNKYPDFVPPNRYRMLIDDLSNYLTDLGRDRQNLLELLQNYEGISNSEKSIVSQAEEAALCMDALNAFLENENKLGLSNINFSKPNILKSININGVEVRPSIDYLFSQRSKDGTDCYGGAKLKLSKPVEPESAKKQRKENGQFISALIYMILKENKPTKDKVLNPKLCWLIDVQQGEIYAIKKASNPKIAQIQNACTMIAALWPQI